MPPTVTGVTTAADTGDGRLDPSEVTDAGATQLRVTFGEDVLHDASGSSAANPANYRLIRDNDSGGFRVNDCLDLDPAPWDLLISIDSVDYDAATRTATLSVNGGAPLPNDVYLLLVCGSTSIQDSAGNELDGNGDGTGGDDFARRFGVTECFTLTTGVNPGGGTVSADPRPNCPGNR